MSNAIHLVVSTVIFAALLTLLAFAPALAGGPPSSANHSQTKAAPAAVVEYEYEEPGIGQYCSKDKTTKGGNACGKQGLN